MTQNSDTKWKNWTYTLKLQYISFCSFADFQIFGGSKVKDTSTSDYLEITIAMHKFGCEGKFFTLRRYNQGGGKLEERDEGFIIWINQSHHSFSFQGYEVMPKGFYWIKKSLTQSVWKQGGSLRA